MRKGTKRKATHKEKKSAKTKEETHSEPNQAAEPSQSAEEESNQEPSRSAAEENNNKPSQAAAEEPNQQAGNRRAKRARVARPEAEPEYFEEKRNLEDLWKEVFPVGTEWDQLDLVYRYKWNFRNLEEAFEEGGELYGKKVYLFSCTEPQLVSLRGEQRMTIIPVVVAVVSPFPPSDKIGIKSVQRVVEEIVPMKQMKMDWVPYIPLENRDSQVERFKSQIFILSCTQRRAGLKHLRLERVKKFEYCLPYFYHPFKEDKFEQSTDVKIIFPAEPPVVCEFDWEVNEIEEFTDMLIEGEQLAADQKDAFKDFVKERVREEKRVHREAREARKKKLEEMSEETKAAFENMKFYKFYPVQTPDTPDISRVKAKYINRYYGNAHKVL